MRWWWESESLARLTFFGIAYCMCTLFVPPSSMLSSSPSLSRQSYQNNKKRNMRFYIVFIIITYLPHYSYIEGLTVIDKWMNGWLNRRKSKAVTTTTVSSQLKPSHLSVGWIKSNGDTKEVTPIPKRKPSGNVQSLLDRSKSLSGLLRLLIF